MIILQQRLRRLVWKEVISQNIQDSPFFLAALFLIYFNYTFIMARLSFNILTLSSLAHDSINELSSFMNSSRNVDVEQILDQKLQQNLKRLVWKEIISQDIQESLFLSRSLTSYMLRSHFHNGVIVF